MNRDFDSILEQSLSQIIAGKARVESCLLAYPALADELKPLLLAAEEVRAIPKPELSPEARDGIEARLLAAARADRRLRPAGLPLPRLRRPAWLRPTAERRPALRPGWRLAFSALAALLLLMVMVTSVVQAAAGSLPSSLLYPVKLASEDVWLWLAPKRAEPALHIRFAHRRLEEFEALLEQGTFEPALLETMSTEVETALAKIEDLPPALAVPALETVVEFTDHQQETLTQLLAGAPAAARPYLLAALQASAEHRLQALALMGRKEREGDWDRAATPSPTSTAGTGTPTPPSSGTVSSPLPAAPIEPTETPRPGETPQPTATAEPAGPEPTPVPKPDDEEVPTSTPEPPQPSRPTATQPPPPTSTQPPPPTATQPPPPTATQPPPPTATQPPPPTATQPPPPTSTQPPPTPEPTKKTPPGHTDTPEPPGQTTRPTRKPSP